METKEINGKLFIIPNAPTGKSDDMKDEDWNLIRESLDRILFPYGLEASEEANVEVWAFSPEVDNWSDHWSDFYEWLGGENVSIESPLSEEECKARWRRAISNSFPKYLPVEILRNLKEGDTLTLYRFDGLKVNLKIAQLDGRYRQFGTFEKVLEQLCPMKKP